MATRVAYSVYGTVRSLNRDAEASVVVEAGVVDQSGRSEPVEETLSDSNGDYRLRGLSPGKQYRIRVKPSSATASGPVRVSIFFSFSCLCALLILGLFFRLSVPPPPTSRCQ